MIFDVVSTRYCSVVLAQLQDVAAPDVNVPVSPLAHGRQSFWSREGALPALHAMHVNAAHVPVVVWVLKERKRARERGRK